MRTGSLCLSFTGIVGLVDHESSGQTASWALLPDARLGGHHHPRHVPGVLIASDLVDARTTWRPEACLVVGGREHSIFLLDGVDLTLTADGERLGDAAPHKEAGAAGYQRIADLGEIDAGASVMSPAGFEDVPRGLVARVVLQGGRFRSGVLSVLPYEVLDKHDGSPHPDWQARRLAETCEYEVQVRAEEVALTATAFDGSFSRLLFLSTAPFEVGSRVDLQVKNMPLDDFIGIGRHLPRIEDRVAASHFDLFYRLSATPPAQTWVPVPTKVLDSSPWCYVSRFSGVG